MIRLLAIAVLSLAGCASRPPVAEPAFSGRHANACMPEAAAMVEGLHEYRIPARVLIYTTNQLSHAIAVYQYGGKVWGWDAWWKTNQIAAADLTDPAACARAWLRVTSGGSLIRAGFE
jgi:hypothetical protein